MSLCYTVDYKWVTVVDVIKLEFNDIISSNEVEDQNIFFCYKKCPKTKNKIHHCKTNSTYFFSLRI